MQTANSDDTRRDIQELEMRLGKLTQELHEKRRAVPPQPVSNYRFDTLQGEVSLLELFGKHDSLLVIHNMGQACRYCTLWGDGIDGFVPHLESAVALVMVSKDPPELQRRFSQSRGWRIRMASHGGGDYMQEQVGIEDAANMPGIVHYRRNGTEIQRLGSSFFGPGDLYCSMWNLLALAGVSESDWTPQFDYWQRPATLEDGGENVL